MVTCFEESAIPLNDAFLASLREDDYGNIVFEKVDGSSNKHSITLQYSARPFRRNENKIDIILQECKAVKKKTLAT